MFRKNFTPNHLFALETTARIGNSTARTIGIAHSNNNSDSATDYWRRYLGDLERLGYVVSKSVYAGGKGKGKRFRMGAFFCLTKKGADLIAEAREEEEGSVHFPAGGIMTKSALQFPHRAMFLELMGSFLAAEDRENKSFEILQIIPYFRFEGSNRLGTGKAFSAVSLPLLPGQPKPVVIVPDGMVWVRVGDSVRLCAVEFHRETSTAGIIKQLRKHTVAIEADLFRKKFSHTHANFVLSVHDDTDKLKRVIEEIRSGEIENFDRYKSGYYFASFDDITEKGLKNSFYSINGEKCRIFN